MINVSGVTQTIFNNVVGIYTDLVIVLTTTPLNKFSMITVNVVSHDLSALLFSKIILTGSLSSVDEKNGIS